MHLSLSELLTDFVLHLFLLLGPKISLRVLTTETPALLASCGQEGNSQARPEVGQLSLRRARQSMTPALQADGPTPSTVVQGQPVPRMQRVWLLRLGYLCYYLCWMGWAVLAPEAQGELPAA